MELRKRFGQHLLKNADVVKKIVDVAQLQPHESVFEIGPGTGNMTIHLLEQARVVYAVELDPRMAASVTARVAKLGQSHKFRCVNADFLQVRARRRRDRRPQSHGLPQNQPPTPIRHVPLASPPLPLQVPLPAFDALVANIPYQISSPVLTRIWGHRPLPRTCVIMFQKEFAGERGASPRFAASSSRVLLLLASGRSPAVPPLPLLLRPRATIVQSAWWPPQALPTTAG